MIFYTIDQAAERVSRKPDTIRQWIRNGQLPVARNPIDGKRYVAETSLLIAERANRVAQRETRQHCGADLRERVTVPNIGRVR